MAKTSTSRKATEKQTEGTQAARSRVGRCPSKAKTPQKKSTRHDWGNEPENVLDSLDIIGRDIQECRHGKEEKNLPAVYEHCKKHFEYIHSVLGLEEMEILFLATFIYLYDGEYTNIREIKDYFKGSASYVLKYLPQLESLEEKGYIIINRYEKGFTFNLLMDAVDALKRGQAPNVAIPKKLTSDEFLTEVHKLCEKTVQGNEKYQATAHQLARLLKNNEHLGIVRSLRNYEVSTDDAFIVLRFCHYFINLNRNIMSLHDLESLYGNNSNLFDSARNQLKRGKHVLQEKGIVEYANQGEFVDKSEYKLTDKAKDELLTEYQDLIIEQSVKGLKNPCDITAKKLFYPTKTQNSIDELAGLLSEKQFVEVRNNLHNKGMRTGFACLFSGAPGTGKTETVLQLAKQTGRPLMQVDIAESKSKWFGESEKKIGFV